MSPFGGIGRKSLLTRGIVGGVYCFGGIEANGCFSSFFGAGAPFRYSTTCLPTTIIPTIHNPTTPDSSQRIPNAPRKKIITRKRIPTRG